MTPKSWATVVKTKSTSPAINTTISPRLSIQTAHSFHPLQLLSNPSMLPLQKSLSLNTPNLSLISIPITRCTSEPNSIQSQTPKRKKRQRRKHKKPRNFANLLSSITQPKYKHLLVSGFIRKHTHSLSLPTDISDLILSFYDETVQWTIKGSEMTKFKSLRNGQALYGPKFNIGNIQFETTLCPCGWKPNQNGSVQFYIELKALPNYIQSLTVYYELSCTETQSFCKKIRTFRKATDAQSWGTNNMRLSECDGFNALTFMCLVKILYIEYKPKYNFNSEIFLEKCELKEMSEYKWEISADLLREFVACQSGKFFYSPNFGNNCFSFELAPNGWHQSNEGRLMLYLRLLRLPSGVRKVYCECEFEGKGMYTHMFGYDMHGLQWPLEVLELSGLKGVKGLRFGVKIRVRKVFGCDGQMIERDRWGKYGILRNYN